MSIDFVHGSLLAWGLFVWVICFPLCVARGRDTYHTAAGVLLGIFPGSLVGLLIVWFLPKRGMRPLWAGPTETRVTRVTRAIVVVNATP